MNKCLESDLKQVVVERDKLLVKFASLTNPKRGEVGANCIVPSPSAANFTLVAPQDKPAAHTISKPFSDSIARVTAAAGWTI